MSKRRLLIDAGNTRLKWAVIESGHWVADGDCDYLDWSGLQAALSGVRQCWVASVAGPVRDAALSAVLAPRGVATRWLLAEARHADLVNAYAVPQQLGVDRWMALVAARARTQEAALVVSAGTALTVDALDGEGVFLGGLIVPGLNLMRQALRAGTAAVDPPRGQVVPFPRNTADAVESGLITALCASVREQHARLAEHGARQPRCFLTGGDAEVLLPHLGLPAEIVPRLVLEGIARVANGEEAE